MSASIAIRGGDGAEKNQINSGMIDLFSMSSDAQSN
jgi:hypothetical protein